MGGIITDTIMTYYYGFPVASPISDFKGMTKCRGM